MIFKDKHDADPDKKKKKEKKWAAKYFISE